MVADGLHHAWPVTAIAVIAVARGCSPGEGGLRGRDRKLSGTVNHTEDPQPKYEQEREGQLCDASKQHRGALA
jgi:hypothetical protein